ncbi:PAS-domain containing protein [Halioxenophilus sp. WMMB6]|uniref:hybrid sensor histidine kinase/response regulator n=1 Tax=Halioxenophilus sp. WMMB6 TaxID=3073815 RepID=UPI00295F45D8|nr:PAS-domain containing protein [Halioxenophilus sp. WMMB6]
MSNQIFLLLVCAYAGLLFAVAWLADRYSAQLQASGWRPLIYALSIGVYCSSWTFLGAVGTAITRGWLFLPIYLGPILMFVFGWPVLRRLLVIARRNRITSVADFIGSRYGKNQWLAAIVTVMMIVGTLPYIALQLRAVVMAWSTIHFDLQHQQMGEYTSFFTALVMAWFSILFGTRVSNDPKGLKGVITAVATESAVKLLAFAAVAVLAWKLLAGPGTLEPTSELVNSDALPNLRWQQFLAPEFITQAFVAACAFIVLPRQFHVMVVEYRRQSDARLARWLVPLYLIAFGLLALPIAFAAARLLTGLNLPADSYVLILPQWTGSQWTLALTFLGTVSAATGMVVVATVALSIMVSNELIVPTWLWASSRGWLQPRDLAKALTMMRRLAIILILLLGWLLEQSFADSRNLASLGLTSFAAAVQVVPALLGGLYWYRAGAKGVLVGLLLGSALWGYCLLLPNLVTAEHPLVAAGPWGIDWLSPHNLFGTGFLDPLSHGVLWSLGLNAAAFYWFSRRGDQSVLEQRQADLFTLLKGSSPLAGRNMEPSDIEVQQLQNLANPLFGRERAHELWQQLENQMGHRLLPHDKAPRFVVQTVESHLAAVMGAISAHRAIGLLARQQPLQIQDFVNLVSGSSRQLQFSHTLLQTTLENITQGISVVDDELRLVAWNLKYQNLFKYPQRLLYVGCKIETIYRFNAERGFLNLRGELPEVAIHRRLENLSSGQPYNLTRVLPDGLVLEIRGTPLSNGGYVTTYTDITDHHRILAQLEESKLHLEERVTSRTRALTELNETLQKENRLRAKVEAELQAVHASRSRFIAAASHDLLQPVNAARLFVTAVAEKLQRLDLPDDRKICDDVHYLDNALAATEELISSLREISRLSSGREQPQRCHFNVNQILEPLAREAEALASEAGLSFRWVEADVWLHSDPKMLRRVAQNFISNALRYTVTGKVLLGCRRKQGALVIEVWDTGPGIAEQDREKIFVEFERLPGNRQNSAQGLGLGLAIAKHMADLLGHPIGMQSCLGHGSVFRITVPLGQAQAELPTPKPVDPRLANTTVLCIDNEESIRAGMRSLLEQWGCRVEVAGSLGQCLNRWTEPEPPNIILADYHLDRETGLEVLQALSLHWEQPIKAVVISADNSESLRQEVIESGYRFMEKPVQPAALRVLMRQLLR